MPFLENIGGAEWLVIGFALLLLFGNKKVNKMAKGLGESTKEFKKAKKEWVETLNDTSLKIDSVTDEIKNSLKESLDITDLKTKTAGPSTESIPVSAEESKSETTKNT